MSDKPVWMETWLHVGDYLHIDPPMSVGDALIGPYRPPTDHPLIPRKRAPCDRVRLAAAAPQMVRALLMVEWQAGREGDQCPDCGSIGKHDRFWRDISGSTSTPCWLDAALTAAGFPDQASRDEARKLIK